MDSANRCWALRCERGFWLLDVNSEAREQKPEGKLYEKAEPYAFVS